MPCLNRRASGAVRGERLAVRVCRRTEGKVCLLWIQWLRENGLSNREVRSGRKGSSDVVRLSRLKRVQLAFVGGPVALLLYNPWFASSPQLYDWPTSLVFRNSNVKRWSTIHHKSTEHVALIKHAHFIALCLSNHFIPTKS